MTAVDSARTVKDRRLAAGLTPAPPRFTVIAVEQQDDYATDGYRYPYTEWFALEVGTGRRLASSTMGPHSAAAYAVANHPGATELAAAEAEVAALAEPRIAVAERPVVQWYMAQIVVEGAGFLRGHAACNFWTDAVIVEGVTAAHVERLMATRYPAAQRFRVNDAGEWEAVV